LIEIIVYVYIEIKFGFNMERDKIAQFLQKLRLNWEKKKIGTKLRIEKMTLGIIVTRDNVIATSYCYYNVIRCQFDMWKNFNF